MRNTIICLLSAANIIIYSFIGLNYEAFQKIIGFSPSHVLADSYSIPSKSNASSEKTLPIEIQPSISLPLHKRATSKTLKLESTLEKFENWEGELSIPKLQIRAKVQHQKNSTEEKFQSLLTEGAISLTPFIPPSKNGQMLLFGHSSDYSWNHNPFGSLFALLPKLEKGDLIELTHQRKTFQYQVVESQITSPDLDTIIQANPGSNQLILSTCYPIGFFSKRYSVLAEPVRNFVPIHRD